jgi:hypothetical protein
MNVVGHMAFGGQKPSVAPPFAANASTINRTLFLSKMNFSA